MTPAIVWTVNIAFTYAFIGAVLFAFVHSEGTAAQVRLERMAKGKRADSALAQAAAGLWVIMFWPWVWGRR